VDDTAGWATLSVLIVLALLIVDYITGRDMDGGAALIAALALAGIGAAIVQTAVGLWRDYRRGRSPRP